MARRRKRKSSSRRRASKAPQARKPGRSKKATKKRSRRTTRASADASGLSLAELQRMVRARESEVDGLQQQRQRLLSELAEVDAQITRHLGRGGAAAPPKKARAGSGRPSGSMRGKLPDLIREALRARGEPMKLREVAAAVVDAGYPTTSKKFGVIVGQRIAEMKDVTKVGHGVYRLK